MTCAFSERCAVCITIVMRALWCAWFALICAWLNPHVTRAYVHWPAQNRATIGEESSSVYAPFHLSGSRPIYREQLLKNKRRTVGGISPFAESIYCSAMYAYLRNTRGLTHKILNCGRDAPRWLCCSSHCGCPRMTQPYVRTHASTFHGMHQCDVPRGALAFLSYVDILWHSIRISIHTSILFFLDLVKSNDYMQMKSHTRSSHVNKEI